MRISPEGADNAQRDNTDHLNTNTGTQPNNPNTVGEFSPEDSTYPPTEGVIPQEAANESVIRLELSRQATNNISRNGSNNIPTRLPMRRVGLGQILRNQFEHRRREALSQAIYTSRQEPNEDGRFYSQTFGQGVPPNNAGSRGENPYALHTATWYSWFRHLESPPLPRAQKYHPNMENLAFWRYPD